MAALKCPNPTCPFLFDPTQVPPGAVLTCPRCGMRFTLGPSPAPPAAEPAPPPAREPDAAPTPRRYGGGIGGGILSLGGVLLLLGVIGAVVVGAAMVKRGIGHGDGEGEARGGGELVRPDYNFAFTYPGSPWERDTDTQNALNVSAFALRRAEPPDAWVALSVTDYKDHNPLLHELRDKMAGHLTRAFDHLPDDLPLEPTRWGGRDAYRCQFRGVRKATETACAGECYVLAYKGVGYWLYTWAGERDYEAVAGELAAVRDRFRTLAERDRWAPPTGVRVTFPRTGVHPVKYQISTYEKYWVEDESRERKETDLALIGTLPGGKSDFKPKAELVVLLYPDGQDPSDVAVREVKKWYTREPETFGKFVVTELTGEPEGDPAPGDEAGGIPATRFAVTVADPNVSKSVEKLVVVSAIQIGDKVVVAEAHCPLSQRKLWERKLVQLVGSLRPG